MMPLPLTIDLNADLGEGSPHEESMMPHLTSAHIACGGHTGDTSTMRESLRLTAVYGVSAGAHPSFPDRVGFGRRAMELSPLEMTAVVREQIEALKEVAGRVGVSIRHVKPHGMLYTLAAQDQAIALAIMRAVAASGIKLYYSLAETNKAGNSGATGREAEKLGLRLMAEGFADRGYAADGSLLPRGQAGALLSHTDAVAQGVSIGVRSEVKSVTGEQLSLVAQTIGLHSDGEGAAAMARDLHSALQAAGVQVKAPQL